MKTYTTYKRLIAKTVILSLLASLAIAFVYGIYIKQRAIDELARVDARKTSRLAFEALYSATEKNGAPVRVGEVPVDWHGTPPKPGWIDEKIFS